MTFEKTQGKSLILWSNTNQTALKVGLRKKLVTSYALSAMSRIKFNPLEQLNAMYTLALSITIHLRKMRQENNEVKMALKAAEEKRLHLCYVFLTFLVLKGKGE